MQTQPLAIDGCPTAYREVKIGRTLYCVTSAFTGEKELGPTLEKLAARRVLDEMESITKNTLRGNSHNTKN